MRYLSHGIALDLQVVMSYPGRFPTSCVLAIHTHAYNNNQQKCTNISVGGWVKEYGYIVSMAIFDGATVVANGM